MTAMSLDDLIQPFQIDAFGLRGRLVRLGPAFTRALAGHDYPRPVGRLLGETMALTAALAGALKYDGLFTLQIQATGPVRLLVCDMTSDGAVRSHANYDAGELNPADDARGEEVPRLLGSGHLAFTVDQGPDTDRYQGVVGLEGGTLSECAHTYFRQSEQLDTAILLAADPAADGGGAGAAALMIQRLPEQRRPGQTREDTDEEWHHAVVLMSSMTRGELLDPALSPADVLYRLYHEEGVRLYEKRPLIYQCRCSRDKVANILRSFPRDEIEELKDNDKVVVTCEFCRADYIFDDADIDALYLGDGGGRVS